MSSVINFPIINHRYWGGRRFHRKRTFAEIREGQKGKRSDERKVSQVQDVRVVKDGARERWLEGMKEEVPNLE